MTSEKAMTSYNSESFNKTMDEVLRKIAEGGTKQGLVVEKFHSMPLTLLILMKSC